MLGALVFLPLTRWRGVPAGLLVNLLIWNQDADLLRLAMGGSVIGLSLWINARFHPRARLAA